MFNVSPTTDAANIVVPIVNFSDGSTEFNADFVSSNVYNKQGISIQSGLWIDDATLNVSTASLGANEYPVNLTLDIGADGSYEWMFKGKGYGQFGLQTLFSNGLNRTSVLLPKNGGTNQNTTVRLPKNAIVRSAVMNITNLNGGGGSGQVAIETSPNSQAKNQVNNDPVWSIQSLCQAQGWTATVVSAADVDTQAELEQYSVVVTGDSGYGDNDIWSYENPLLTWVQNGGGFVGIGWMVYFTGSGTSMDKILPVKCGGVNYIGNGNMQIVDSTHEIATGVSNFPIQSYCEYPTNGVDSGSTTIMNTPNGQPGVVAGECGEGRSVWIGPIGFGCFQTYSTANYYNDNNFKTMLANSIGWVAKKSLLNCSLDVGNDGTIEWKNETLNSSEWSPNLAPNINAYLASAAPNYTDAYGNQFVDVPLALSSNTSGTVRFSNLSLVYDYTATVNENPGGNLTMSLNDLMPIKVSPNNSTIPIVIISDSPGRLKVKSLNIRAHPPNHQPTLASFEPVGPQVMDENASLDFSVSAVDIYGNPLTYQWFHNSVPVEGMTDAAFTLETDYNDAGNHTVTIRIMNGLDTLGHTWDVAVLDANRAPVITGSTPPDNPTTPENASIAFTVNATDPDGDTLLYSWALDGKTVPRANLSTYSYLGDFYSSGDHMVTATVTDLKNASTSKLWKLTVENTNVAPYIVEYQPRNNPKMRELESVRFSVSGADIDNQSVSATWYLDGVQMYVGTSYTYKTDYTSAGIHEVKVVVSDGFLDVFRTWKVTVENVNRLPSPAIDSPKDVLDYMSGDVVKFSAKSSSDIDNDPLNFTWKEDTVVLSTQMEFERTFAPGLHTITLYVLDPYGGLNSTTVRFRVRNVELAGIIGLDRLDIKPGDKVSIIATLSNIGDANSTSFNVEVLVDGTSLGSKSIAQLNAGSAQRETFAWKAGKAGNHTVVLKVGEKSWQKTIYVESRAVETTDTAAGTNEAIGMMLILVVMVVLLAFGIAMMRRK